MSDETWLIGREVDASKKIVVATGNIVFDFELFIGERSQTKRELNEALVISITLSHVFFDHRESNQTSNVLNTLSKITKRRTPVHTVFVGIDVALNLVGIRH